MATLPGIVKAAMAMPDIHLGYGFPIGGVAAFDWDTGVISPGGVGYDINCGVRLATTALSEKEVRPHLETLANHLFQTVPSGVGSKGSVRLSVRELKQVLTQGSAWAVAQGFGEGRDIEHTEENGCLAQADPGLLSDRALNGAETSWAPWDPAIIFWKSGWWKRYLMTAPPGCSACFPAR